MLWQTASLWRQSLLDVNVEMSVHIFSRWQAHTREVCLLTKVQFLSHTQRNTFSFLFQVALMCHKLFHSTGKMKLFKPLVNKSYKRTFFFKEDETWGLYKHIYKFEKKTTGSYFVWSLICFKVMETQEMNVFITLYN